LLELEEGDAGFAVPFQSLQVLDKKLAAAREKWAKWKADCAEFKELQDELKMLRFEAGSHGQVPFEQSPMKAASHVYTLTCQP